MLPKLNDNYIEDGTLVGFLGTRAPSWLEIVGARIYQSLNNGWLLWSHTSSTVSVIRAVGTGMHGAALVTALIVVLGTFIGDPPPLGQYNLERGDLLGDVLVLTTFILWIINALLLFVARIVHREKGFPWKAVPRLPDLLFNDTLPDERDPSADTAWAWLFVVYGAGAALTITSAHTLLAQVYQTRNVYFAVLFCLKTAYLVVAGLRDITRCGSGFGLPRGTCRWLTMVRALVFMPLLVIFSVFSLIVSFPWYDKFWG